MAQEMMNTNLTLILSALF